MKRILFVLGLLVGVSGILLYQWLKPIDDDPYFFLSPKIAEGHPINIPIKLYKKGTLLTLFFGKLQFLPLNYYIYSLYHLRHPISY